jgi:hypothetical protein
MSVSFICESTCTPCVSSVHANRIRPISLGYSSLPNLHLRRNVDRWYSPRALHCVSFTATTFCALFAGIAQRCYNKQHVFEDVFDVLLAWEGTALPMTLLPSWGEEGFVSDTMVSSFMLLLFWSDESIEFFLPSCKLLLVISGFCSCWELEWLESASFAESTVK